MISVVQKRALLWAVLASFAIYFTPLIGPHAALSVVEVLYKGPAAQNSSWRTLNVALALAAQMFSFAVWWWVFRKPAWRALALLPLIPIGLVLLNWAYLVAIPTRFLEEPDSAPESTSWAPVCVIPGYSLTPLRAGDELWLRSNSAPDRYGVLQPSNCSVSSVNIPQPPPASGRMAEFTADPTYVIPGGRALIRKFEPRSGGQTWFVTTADVPGPVAVPPGYTNQSPAPVLSSDGRWSAWLQTIPNTGPPVLSRVLLRSSNQEQTVDLSSLGAATYSVLAVDAEARTLDLWRNDARITASFDGTLVREAPRAHTVRPQQNTYLLRSAQWLAWDAYREDGPYRVEWSFTSGNGGHAARLGRTINSADFDTAGRIVAISVTTALNIGSASDAVYVLDVAGHREVFRKYLPRYTRSVVAFVEPNRFVYSDVSGVHVLRIPD